MTTLLVPGCESSDYRLAWSVRRGQVGEFAIRDDDVVTIGARLAVYDTATGRRRRSTVLPADFGDPTRGQLGPGAMVADDSIVFGWYDFETATGTVFCFDAETLRPRWQWQIHWPWRQRTLRPTVAVVAAGERLYAAAVGKDGDNLFAFRLADGRLVWSRSVESFPTETGLAVAGHRLIVRSQLWARTRDWHEQVDAIALADGRRLWRTWLMGETKHHTGGPLIDGDGHLYVVRLADGQTRRDDIPTAGAPFAKRGDTIYLGGAPTVAWDARARQPLWQSGDAAPAPPMIADGALDDEQRRVFTGDSRQFVYVLAAADGMLRARIRVDAYPRFELLRPLKALYGAYGVRRLQVHRGMLFVATLDSSVFVFRLQ
jgi:outer membrane protein assembly factor BamB